jgi:orotidine-5'-phosphate decarboxylase
VAAAPFAERLEASALARRSRVCLGVDPRPSGHPLMAGGDTAATAARVIAFYRAVLDGAHEAVACVKPQSAFFEALGPAGIDALAVLLEHARALDLPILLDAKRGDIGSTADAYAEAYLADGPLAADALTVSPYLGVDTLEPFARRAAARGRGLFVRVVTSNPGAASFQELVTEDGRRLFEHVADAVDALAREHGPAVGYGPIGAVVGATRPARLRELRARLPRSLLLVPGYGAQGGTADDVVAAFDESGGGAIVSSSRDLVPGAHATDLAAVRDAARAKAEAMRDDLDRALGTALG